jgi:hypothetical protein
METIDETVEKVKKFLNKPPEWKTIESKTIATIDTIEKPIDTIVKTIETIEPKAIDTIEKTSIQISKEFRDKIKSLKGSKTYEEFISELI